MTARSVEQWLITAPQETFEAILSVTGERSDQEDKGYTPEHDDKHGLAHIVPEAWKRLGSIPLSNTPDARAELVQVAAMLVAAIEVIDRSGSASSGTTGSTEP